MLHHSAGIQHQNFVVVDDGAEPVCDTQNRAVEVQPDLRLDKGVCLAVNTSLKRESEEEAERGVLEWEDVGRVKGKEEREVGSRSIGTLF